MSASGTSSGRGTRMMATGVVADGVCEARGPRMSLSTSPRRCSQERNLVLVQPRELMTMATACLIGLPTPHHDHRRVVAGGLPLDESLIATGGAATDHADRVQLVHHIGNGHELRHGAERLTAEIGVGACENHADAARGERRGEWRDTGVQELRLINR